MIYVLQKPKKRNNPEWLRKGSWNCKFNTPPTPHNLTHVPFTAPLSSNHQCSADLPPSIRMGRVQVGCEGWESSQDPYILKGSCGLEYTLLKAFADGTEDSRSNLSSKGILDLLFQILFWGITVIVIFYALSSCLGGNRGATPGAPPRAGGGGGGGGWGGGGWGGGGWGSGGDGDTDSGGPPPYSKTDPPQAQAAPGRTGTFWGDVRTGAARGVGHVAVQAAANSLFGGGSRSTYPTRRDDRDPYRGAGRWGNGSSGSSSGLRSSSGFGGTRNR